MPARSIFAFVLVLVFAQAGGGSKPFPGDINIIPQVMPSGNSALLELRRMPSTTLQSLVTKARRQGDALQSTMRTFKPPRVQYLLKAVAEKLGCAAGNLGRGMRAGNARGLSMAGMLMLPTEGLNGVLDIGEVSRKSMDDFSNLGKTVLGAGIFALACSKFATRWVAVGGTAKLMHRLPLYLTIPIIAGLLNWTTNRLAVWMIFNPLEFRGVPLISRPRQGEPLGWFGWQGIVPAKVEQMGADIIDLVLDLVSVRAIFQRLDGAVIAEQMARDGALVRAIANAAAATETLPGAVIEAARRKAEGEGSVLGDTIERKAKTIVQGVMKAMAADPLRYCSIRSSVISRMKENRGIVCDLFQRCGREELKFIIDVGLWGGAALGLVQMGLWVVWDPKWSLALGGALVGYVTNWMALYAMFKPVEPWRGPDWLQDMHRIVTGREWDGIQGLFLTRQEEVSVEFSDFVTTSLLAPPQIWDAILLSPSEASQRSITERRIVRYDETAARQQALAKAEEGEGARREVDALEDLLARSIMAEAWPLVRGGKDGARQLASQLRVELLDVVPATFDYIGKTLDLKPDLYSAMASLPSARFERVLHPIFEEDELTLIAVGGMLGGIAGYGQTFFY